MIKIDGWAFMCWKGTTEDRQSFFYSATSHTLSMSREMRETSSDGNARRYYPDKLTWSLKIDKLVALNESGMSPTASVVSMKNGDVFDIAVLIGLDYYSGKAMVTNVSVKAPLKGAASASINLIGCSMLVKSRRDALSYGLSKIFK